MATVWRTAWGVFSMVALVCVVIAAVAWVRDWRRGTTELGDERDRLRPTPAAMIAMGTLLQPAASPRSLSAQRERQSAGRDRGQATRPITTDAKPINQVPMSADELDDSQPPQLSFHVIAGLSTDEQHWRRNTVVSVVLAIAAAAGARRAHGPARVVLAVAAIVLLLPAISLAAMIGLALLVKRLDRGPAQDPSAVANRP